MSTYNTIQYARTVTGLTASGTSITNTVLDPYLNRENKHVAEVQFDTSITPLAQGDVVNLITRPANVIPTSIKLSSTAAVTGSATIAIGTPTNGTAFTGAAISTITAANNTELYTNPVGFGAQLGSAITLVANFAGANIGSAAKFTFLIETIG